jgi:hypothetical protein
MIDKTTAVTACRRRVTTGILARPRSIPRQRSDPRASNERVRLITFVWTGLTGDQPVIYADRTWLQ